MWNPLPEAKMTEHSAIPRFAIVGHPNKGKSSLVSTLSQDESVGISPLSGTTVENGVYPMEVDGTPLYQLIDTPGFQRARAAIEWMQKRSVSPADRVDTVAFFIKENQDNPLFQAECQLLQPIIDGAGILYVVDGSRPYGPEYDAEMEILRWTGQPSMALINQISSGNFMENWQRALSQYFRIVRIFNAQTADFDKQVQLLSGFAELNEGWNAPLSQAVTLLRNQRQARRQTSAHLIAAMIYRMMKHTEEQDVPDQGSSSLSEQAQFKFRQSIAAMEQDCRSAIENLYNYRRLQRQENELSIIDEDLFSDTSWRLFGLTSDQTTVAGAIGGAATGGVIDTATAGTSLLLGTGLGALIGGVTAHLGSDTLVKTRISGKLLGKKKLTIGPIKNISFPYVVLGRALTHHSIIEKRTHAQREAVQLEQPNNLIDQLFKEDRHDFDRLFAKIRKRNFDSVKLIDHLTNKIAEKLRT